MATPTGPTQPNLALTAQRAKLITVNDNVARLQFGGHFWDVSVHELIDASGANTNTKLTLTPELATKIQGIFERLVAKSAFNPDKTRRIELKGYTKQKTAGSGTSTAEMKFEEMQVEEDPAKGLQKVSQSTFSVAKPILDVLGETLAEAHDQLHAPPSLSSSSSASSASSASPTAVAGATTASPLAARTRSATPPTPEVTRTVTRDPLQIYFKDRPVNAALDPADMIMANFYSTPHPISDVRIIKNAMADYVGGAITAGVARFDHGKGFTKDECFEMVFSDLKFIQNKDSRALTRSAEKFTGGPFSVGKFPGGRLGELLNKDISLVDEPEKKLLVQLYAQYLRDGGTAMGDSFFEIFNMFSRDPTTRAPFALSKQIVILEQDVSGKVKIFKKIPPKETIRLSDCIFIKKTGNVLQQYAEQGVYANPPNGHIWLAELSTLTSLDPTTETQTLHKAATGANPTGGDVCLALQLLERRLTGAAAIGAAAIDTEASALRTAAIGRLRERTFTARPNGFTALGNTPNTDKVKESLLTTLESGVRSLRSQKFEDELKPLLAEFSNSDRTPIRAEVSAALTNLLANNASGADQFNHFKSLIRDAYRNETSPPKVDHTDAEFGQKIIDLAAGNFNPPFNLREGTQADATDIPKAKEYILKALNALIKEQQDETDRIFGLCRETRSLTDTEAHELSGLYADALERHHAESDIGPAFFTALVDARTTAAAAAALPAPAPAPAPIVIPNICILVDNTDAATRSSKPFVVQERYPPAAAGAAIVAADTNFLWYDGKGHYHSLSRDAEVLGLIS